MKISALFLGIVPVAALAMPPSDAALVQRQSTNAVTDELLFGVTLPQFTTRRNARNPANLDWASDGCTSSPDNPLGFPYVPACHRHDFGIQNYRNQARFTKSGKASIDNQFKTDLLYQCRSVNSLIRGLCNALAEVYYAAVRAFGGGETTKKRDEDLVREYDEKVAIYNALFELARARGDLDGYDV